MTEIAMRRENSHLVPVDEVSADEVRAIPTTQDVLVTVKTPRNLKQFRLAWALAQKVSDAVDFLPDRDSAMAWLKIKARHVTMLQDPRTNHVAILPKSIAFASLSQDAFARVFNRMIYVTCAEVIPGLDDKTLRAEIEAMVGADTPKPKRAAPEAVQGAPPASQITPPPASGPDPEKRATEAPAAKAAPTDAAECRAAEEYVEYVRNWIDGFEVIADRGHAQGRFDDEYVYRLRLGVGVAQVTWLQKYLDDHFAKIKAVPK